MVALATLVYLGRSYFSEIHRIKQAPLLLVCAILLVYMLTQVVRGQILRLALRNLGHHVLNLYEAFMLLVMMAYGNLIIPKAGVGAPGIYLKLKHQVTYAEYGSLMAVSFTVLQLICIGVLGVGVVGFIGLTTPDLAAPWWIYALFAGVAVGAVVSLYVPVKVPERWQNRVARFLRNVTESWKVLRSSPSVVLMTLGLHVISILLKALRLYVALRAVGAQPSFAGALAASLLADLTLLFSITPSGLGLREAAIAYGGQLMGTEADVALSAAILDRLVWTIGVALIGQVGFLHLARPLIRRGENAPE